ncbi:MAG: hypothetical protein C0606_09620 [Hyphomicrobiales bacterium]|nr:MAG: hypothetical protein C0606_09620 [Hyphomicrobiales bacterium]
MTQTSNRLFDEFAKLMNDAAGVAQGMKREAGTMARSQFERFVADMDLVPREDFEAVKELAANARAEASDLAERVAALEERLAKLEGGKSEG